MLEQLIGLGIDEGVRFHAARICDIEREEMVVEFQLSLLVSEPQFLPYRKVFARFGFDRRVEALLLSQIYPFENYLAADGKPDVKIRNGRLSDKATKRHLSLRRFCKALGYAPSQESSGDINRSRVHGVTTPSQREHPDFANRLPAAKIKTVDQGKKMSITPEEQLRLSACIEEIAQILYKNTASEEIATLEGLEKVVRQQMLEYVSPKVALFLSKKSPKRFKGDRARSTVV